MAMQLLSNYICGFCGPESHVHIEECAIFSAATHAVIVHLRATWILQSMQ